MDPRRPKFAFRSANYFRRIRIFPTISPDRKKVYYLVRAGGARNFLTGELWVADLESGQRERLLPDFRLRHYNISADGERIVFVAADEKGRTPFG